jgi:hypothetical protein
MKKMEPAKHVPERMYGRHKSNKYQNNKSINQFELHHHTTYGERRLSILGSASPQNKSFCA